MRRIHQLEESKDDPDTPRGRYGEVFDLEPGLVYQSPSNKTLVSRMRVTLAGGLTVELSGDNIQHPLMGLNSSGMPVTNPEMTEISIFREPGIGKAPVLGRAIMSKVRAKLMTGK